FLSVWGNRGPTIVLTANGPQEAPVSVRTGYVLPVLRTATGRVFLSYLPRSATSALVEQERNELHGEGTLVGASEVCGSADKLIEDCRRAGFAVRQCPDIGFADIAAPVFDHHGLLAGVATVIGPGNQLEPDAEGATVPLLTATADTISRALGLG